MKSPSSKLKRPTRKRPGGKASARQRAVPSVSSARRTEPGDGIRSLPAKRHRWPVPEMAELTADDICWEVSLFLRIPLPRDRYVRWLAAKAELCFQGNAHFRKKMMGARCREWLRVFMRHWMYSLLRCERPDLHADLPESFTLGHPLSQARPLRPGRRRIGAKQDWNPARVLAHPRWQFLAAA